ncbi:MAG: thioredoxin family protein [Anaeromyxobacteraceae bacterium]|nr:thioredoxin family protein [Anaeromyxobacteraceae bacterium]
MANRFGVWVPGTDDLARKEAEALNVPELAEKDYEAQVAGSALPVVLGFYETGSKACEALAPRLAAVAAKHVGKVRFFKVQAAANAALAGRHGVTGSPTVVFLEGGQEKGERLTGDEIQRTVLKARVEGLLGMPAVAAAVAAAQPA